MRAPGLAGWERVYRLLLRVYPESFRRRYGEDAVELFRDSYRATHRERGLLGCAFLCARTLPSVLLHGVTERVTSWGSRDVRPAGFLAATAGAVRRLSRHPSLTLTVMLTLGVAIGANVALFALVRGVLIRPLPYFEPERLVRVWETNPEVDGELHGPSPLNFADWERAEAGFESMAAWYLTSGTYRGDFEAEEIRAAQVTADFFRVLGVEPALGRDLRREEVVRYGPLMLSDRAWRRLYAADPTVVGETVVVSDRTYEIVGVMPPSFAFPDESVEIWIAWDLPAVYGGRPETRTWRFLDAIGRLASGATLERAEAQLAAVARGLSDAHPAENAGWDVALTGLHEEMVGEARGALWMAFGAVLFILLIACSNVATLLLARVPARARDLAIRSALGASRRRLLRELLAEHAVLSVAAGLGGLGLAKLMLQGLVAVDAGRIPRLTEVGIDAGVLVFALAATALTGVIFGLAPTLQSLGNNVPATLRQGTRGSSTPAQQRTREVFVASQVAVALVLLLGAGLFQSSLTRLIRQDPGIVPTNVATFRVSLDPVEGDPGAISRYYDGLLSRIRDLPGVEVAGAAQTLPLNPVGNDFSRPYRPPGSELESADAPTVQIRIVTPGYLDAVGMRLVNGGPIPGSIRPDEPLVALVNETLARRMWPGASPVGEALEIDFREGWQTYLVVGVVQDVKHYGPRAPVRPEVYLSHAQVPYLAMSVAARTVGDPEATFEALREAVLSHVPMQPPHHFVTLAEVSRESVAEERFLSALLQVFGAIALLLATTGVYGVISYSVSQRRAEIGIRLALGARPTVVAGAVLGRAVALSAAGVAGGLLVAFPLGGLVEGLLFGITPRDPTTVVVVSVLLLVVASVAAWVPARRAARVAPAQVLRSG